MVGTVQSYSVCSLYSCRELTNCTVQRRDQRSSDRNSTAAIDHPEVSEDRWQQLYRTAAINEVQIDHNQKPDLRSAKYHWRNPNWRWVWFQVQSNFYIKRRRDTKPHFKPQTQRSLHSRQTRSMSKKSKSAPPAWLCGKPTSSWLRKELRQLLPPNNSFYL